MVGARGARLTSTAALDTRPRSIFHGGVVVLVGLMVFINYVDRGLLPSAAPLMKGELGLTASQIGILLSAFFWTYTPCQILSGWLSERIGAYRTLAIGVAIWSVATALTGLASGFSVLIGLRLLLGLGESAAFPCASKLFADRLPAHRLGAANAFIGLGLSLGPAFGAFFGGMMMAQAGWRPVFVLFGLASLLWLIPWIIASRREGADYRHEARGALIPFRRIVKRRALWGAALGHFSGNYALYFVVSWMPLFLVKARGFSMSEMAGISGVIYLAYAASCAVTGWLSDRWMAAGASATRVRKGFLVAGSLGSGLAFAGCAVSHGPLTLVSLLAAGISFGFASPNIFAAAQTIAGPRAAGAWVGLQNGFGNIAGIVAPLITGAVIDATGEFKWAFVIAGAAALLGVIGWGVIVQRVERIDWDAA